MRFYLANLSRQGSKMKTRPIYDFCVCRRYAVMELTKFVTQNLCFFFFFNNHNWLDFSHFVFMFGL